MHVRPADHRAGRRVTTGLRALAACVSLLACTAASHAAADMCSREAPWTQVASIDERVDIALTIENGAEQFESPQGRAMSRFIADSGLFDDTIQAWRALSRSLGVEADEIPSRLLGQRVTVLLDVDRPVRTSPFGIASLPEIRWALVTGVDAEMERRVRRRLHAAPRETRPRATVLAIEDGRFRLAVVSPPGMSPRLVLAPAGSDEMFEIGIGLARQPAAEAPTRTPGAGQTNGPGLPHGEIIGYARLNALAQIDTPSTLSFSARRVASGWHTDLVVDGCELGPAGASMSAARFLELARGAVGAVVVDDAVSALAELRQAVGTAASGARPPTVTGPLAVLVFPSGAPAQSETGPFTAQIVANLTGPDPHARFDALVSTYLVPFQDTRGAAGLDHAFGNQFEGRFPSAVRRQPITITPKVLARVFGTSAEVAWRYAGDGPDQFGVLTCAPQSAPDPRSAAAFTSRSSDVVGPQDAHAGPGVTFAAMLRPALFARTLVREDPRSGPLASLGWIRELRIVLTEPLSSEDDRQRGELILLTNADRRGLSESGRPR